MPAFFPDPLFGWAYLAALFGVLLAAAWNDLRTLVVPKRLTVPAVGLGVVFNVARGVWLAAEGQTAWLLGDHGPLVGAVDGLLFALLGFLVAFGLFFLMWVLGVCGGGDVKLFAAVGAWVGPGLTLRVLLATLAVVFLFLLGRLLLQLFGGDWKAFRKTMNKGQAPRRRSGPAGLVPRKRALGFALPLVIAAALVLPWSFRVDLRLAAAPAQDAPGEHAHAR